MCLAILSCLIFLLIANSSPSCCCFFLVFSHVTLILPRLHQCFFSQSSLFSPSLFFGASIPSRFLSLSPTRPSFFWGGYVCVYFVCVYFFLCSNVECPSMLSTWYTFSFFIPFSSIPSPSICLLFLPFSFFSANSSYIYFFFIYCSDVFKFSVLSTQRIFLPLFFLVGYLLFLTLSSFSFIFLFFTQTHPIFFSFPHVLQRCFQVFSAFNLVHFSSLILLSISCFSVCLPSYFLSYRKSVLLPLTFFLLFIV